MESRALGGWWPMMKSKTSCLIPHATVSISSQSVQLPVCPSGPRHCISDEHVPVVTLQPAPDLELCLLCWVRGEDHNSVFPVKISWTETIGALKEVIKEKMKPDFSDISTSALKLWKASTSGCRCELLPLTEPLLGQHRYQHELRRISRSP